MNYFFYTYCKMANEVKNLTGRRIVVTGASSGIGYAMAKALAAAGASVLLTARSEERLNSAIEQLQKEGGQVFGQIMDVRREDSIQQVVAWVEQQWACLDVLINNAGIGMRTVNPSFLTEPQPFYKVSAEGFRDVIDTNLTGYFLVAKAFMPL